MKTTPRILSASAALALLFVSACGHNAEPGHGGNEGEVITTVILEWTPTMGGDTRRFVFDDPDGDGGDPPTVDTIDLAAGDYDVQVLFENRLETPVEDITQEIADEAQDHQVFFTGSAVSGPASDSPDAALVHGYDDLDRNGLPIGLQNQLSASTGDGELIVTLRHLPPLTGGPQKDETNAASVKAAGFSAIGGSSDAQVRFAAEVL